MKCGFNKRTENKDCTDKCIYFQTCARNPYRKEKGNGRRKVDQDNHRHIQ